MESKWRLIENEHGDVADIVSYGASVAEGRIAGKYQLSTTQVPDTLIVQRSETKGLVIGADIEPDREAAGKHDIEIARSARQGRNSAKTVGTVQLSELMAKGSKNFKAVEVDPDDPAVLIYTSGTTGHPKGVMLSHRNFHFQVGTIVRSLIPVDPKDRYICVLPLYHVYGLANALIPAIHFGAAAVLVSQYSPQKLLDAIAENQATVMPAVPTMYYHLLTIAKSRKTKIPTSLKYCVSGGAPLPLSVLQKFAETYDTKILEGYGLSETTSSVCANGFGGVFKDGSIGPAATGVEMRVVDEEGKEVAQGEEGEIVIRSPTVTQGYWNNPEATRETITDDGWFHTGDLGYVDGDGFYFITDRKKDIIITRGFNISPREVEEVLIHHQKVDDAALVAIKNDRDGEVITAFIVPSDPENPPTVEELREYCSLNLAEYKWPKDYRFAQALPRSATGKVLRAELRGESEDRRLIEKES